MVVGVATEPMSSMCVSALGSGAMQMFIYETNAKRSPMTNGYAFPQLVWRIPAEGLARSQMRPKGSAHHHRGSIVSQPSSRS